MLDGRESRLELATPMSLQGPSMLPVKSWPKEAEQRLFVSRLGITQRVMVSKTEPEAR